jgi:hypothetical protein
MAQRLVGRRRRSAELDALMKKVSPAKIRAQLSESEEKPVRVNFLVSADEKRRMEAMAKHFDLSLSAYLRQLHAISEAIHGEQVEKAVRLPRRRVN